MALTGASEIPTAAIQGTHPAGSPGRLMLAGRLSLLLAAIPLLFAGCSTVHWNKAEFRKQDKTKKAKSEQEEFGAPVKMVVIWRDAVYDQGTTKPARGFGGRFYFYDRQEKPVKVDGELVIYAFDETAQEQEGIKRENADRKYVFKAEELQGHFGETALGASYSFWIPWDEIGGTRRSVALIPVFKTSEGNMVRGDQTVNVLSGKSPSKHNDHQIVADGGQIRKISNNWEAIREKNLRLAGFEPGDEENANFVTTASAIEKTTVISVPQDSTLRSRGGIQPAAMEPQVPRPLQPAATTSTTPADAETTSPDRSRNEASRHRPGNPAAGETVGFSPEARPKFEAQGTFQTWKDFSNPPPKTGSATPSQSR